MTLLLGVFISLGPDRRPDLSKDADWRPDDPTGQEDKKLARSTRAIRHNHATKTVWARAAHAYGHNRAPIPRLHAQNLFKKTHFSVRQSRNGDQETEKPGPRPGPKWAGPVQSGPHLSSVRSGPRPSTEQS